MTQFMTFQNSRFLSILLYLGIGNAFFNSNFCLGTDSNRPTNTDQLETKRIAGIDLISGNNVDFRIDTPNRISVVTFLSIRCPCSFSHQTELEAISKQFTTKDIRFIGVHSNANEGLDDASLFFSQSKITFPIVHDPISTIANHFKAFKTPHVFVVNSNLEILFQGGIDNSKSIEKATQHFLRDALTMIIGGKLPLNKNVRVVGCQIQRP